MDKCQQTAESRVTLNNSRSHDDDDSRPLVRRRRKTVCVILSLLFVWRKNRDGGTGTARLRECRVRDWLSVRPRRDVTCCTRKWLSRHPRYQVTGDAPRSSAVAPMTSGGGRQNQTRRPRRRTTTVASSQGQPTKRFAHFAAAAASELYRFVQRAHAHHHHRPAAAHVQSVCCARRLVPFVDRSPSSSQRSRAVPVSWVFVSAERWSPFASITYPLVVAARTHHARYFRAV